MRHMWIESKLHCRMRTRGPVAQWIRRLTSDQKIAGSSPARVVFYYMFNTRPLTVLRIYFSIASLCVTMNTKSQIQYTRTNMFYLHLLTDPSFDRIKVPI